MGAVVMGLSVLSLALGDLAAGPDGKASILFPLSRLLPLGRGVHVLVADLARAGLAARAGRGQRDDDGGGLL